MNSSTKKWLISAASLVVIGLIIIAVTMTAGHWNFSHMDTGKYETNTYEITEVFSNIDINTKTADINFAKSSDGMCKVVCFEEQETKHSVSVKNGTLTVSLTDERTWKERIGLNVKSPKITVYLPESEYSVITVNEHTGDILLQGLSVNELNLALSTGCVDVSSVNCDGKINVVVTTGEMKLSDISCDSLISSGSTGEVVMENVISKDSIVIERSTGDIRFEGCDAGELEITTSTGSVTGSLLSSKIFYARTDTGKVAVPFTTSGGKCKITTGTGDIRVKMVSAR